jgi:hypothetical protein
VALRPLKVLGPFFLEVVIENALRCWLIDFHAAEFSLQHLLEQFAKLPVHPSISKGASRTGFR